MENYLIRIDKIKWHIERGLRGRRVQPLCPIHSMRLKGSDYDRVLMCEDCPKSYQIPRNLENERRYVLNRIDANIFKGMKVLNLDDGAIPLAESKNSGDDKYFVASVLTVSKTGKRLVVYAGEKGKKEKTQILVEPEIKRLAFDQNNLHPNDVFTKLEATFSDGSTASQQSKR